MIHITKPTPGRTRFARVAIRPRPPTSVPDGALALPRARPARAGALAALVVALTLAAAPGAQASGDWPWPVDGELVTTYRNGPDPYAAGQHRGIDIAGEVGDPVRAAAAGTVRYAGSLGSSGVTVSIRTADGRYDTSYLHLSEVAVRRGEEVASGNRIGAVGVSGQRSVEAPHLHFGVRVAGSDHDYRDPTISWPRGPPRSRAPRPRSRPRRAERWRLRRASQRPPRRRRA
jgi:murein DD-endopeptidase MepM/ murein hydrolase activator NlpD